MTGRSEPRRKRTCVEFFKLLGMPRSKLSRLRRYYCTLRRCGMGQTTSLIAALIALDVRQCDISRALGNAYNNVKKHWKRVRHRFSMDGKGDLICFLNDPKTGAGGRRSIPTPQERPFRRPHQAQITG